MSCARDICRYTLNFRDIYVALPLKGLTLHSTQSTTFQKRVLLDKQLHRYTDRQTHNNQEPGTQRVQALADISRSRYVATATQHMHRLQIRPTVHNQGASPKLHPGPCNSAWACGRGQIDTQTQTRDHYTFRVYDSREM